MLCIRYSVAVDSSVLGAECDGYVHRYSEVREEQPAPEWLRAPLDACDALEAGGELARFEPLREFTLPHRDPAHDDHFTRYHQSRLRAAGRSDTTSYLRELHIGSPKIIITDLNENYCWPPM